MWDDWLSYYASTRVEAERLLVGEGRLEMARTQEIVQRFLPPAPAVIFDVGGGPGVYACWLAALGYEVHLIDAVPLHVEMARKASRAQPEYPIRSILVGDARKLDRDNSSVDAVLLFGPLYHLTERSDRLTALREAGRILRDGGVLFAAAISRFSSILDGIRSRLFDDPEFLPIVRRDLKDGQHRNPTNNPVYFTTSFLHHPDELKAEIEDAGLGHEGTFGVEGPFWLLKDLEEHWGDPARRERLLNAIRWVEREPSLLGASAHLIVVARRAS